MHIEFFNSDITTYKSKTKTKNTAKTKTKTEFIWSETGLVIRIKYQTTALVIICEVANRQTDRQRHKRQVEHYLIGENNQ